MRMLHRYQLKTHRREFSGFLCCFPKNESMNQWMNEHMKGRKEWMNEIGEDGTLRPSRTTLVACGSCLVAHCFWAFSAHGKPHFSPNPHRRPHGPNWGFHSGDCYTSQTLFLEISKTPDQPVVYNKQSKQMLKIFFLMKYAHWTRNSRYPIPWLVGSEIFLKDMSFISEICISIHEAKPIRTFYDQLAAWYVHWVKYYYYWLVVWNINFIFPYIGNI